MGFPNDACSVTVAARVRKLQLQLLLEQILRDPRILSSPFDVKFELFEDCFSGGYISTCQVHSTLQPVASRIRYIFLCLVLLKSTLHLKI
jgi:hypothetical protein